MKTLTRALLLCTLIFASSFGIAKSFSHNNIHPSLRKAVPIVPIQSEQGKKGAVKGTLKGGFVPSEPLSALVVPQGADPLGISTHYYVQSNGRALHNICIDPDDANKIHAVIMATTDNSNADSIKGEYPSRRALYCYSADAGKTWTAPKALGGNTRLGYPQMLLYKRDGVNVPVIIAHQGPDPENEMFVIQLYIEQGAPGEGNFKMTPADRMASNGSEFNLIFPNIALSKDQTTLHVISAPTFPAVTGQPPQYGLLEYGNFTLNADRSAKWNGWKNNPGGTSTVEGYASAGNQVIAVSDDGSKIGVVWIQPEKENGKIYFVESTNNGTSWTENYLPVYTPDGPNAQNALLEATDGLDMFYDEQGKAQFFWEADYRSIDANTFYPYSSMLFKWGIGDPTVKILTTLIAPEFSDLQVLDKYLPVEVLHEYQLFDGSVNRGSYDSYGIPIFSDLTVSRVAGNSKVMRAYYTAFVEGDEGPIGEDLDNDGTDDISYFRNIMQQTSYDGGLTWSEPTISRGNVGVPDGEKLDHFYPQVPGLSPSVSGLVNFNTLFAADSFPGNFTGAVYGNGNPGWSYISWYHQDETLNRVNDVNTIGISISLGQNYPNPSVAGKTVIPFELTNGGEVVLTITDLLGREVVSLSPGRMEAGKQTLPVDITRLTSGVYQYTLRSGGESLSRLMTVVKD